MVAVALALATVRIASGPASIITIAIAIQAFLVVRVVVLSQEEEISQKRFEMLVKEILRRAWGLNSLLGKQGTTGSQ